MLEITDELQIPLSEINFSYSRSSGPGGQKVNTSSTKATLHWNVVESPQLSEAVRERFLSTYANRINSDGDIVISSDTHRTQNRNTEACLERLKEMLISVLDEPKERVPTKTPKGVNEKRLQDKKSTAVKKKTRSRVTGEE